MKYFILFIRAVLFFILTYNLTIFIDMAGKQVHRHILIY
jgi:hypothetical protein